MLALTPASVRELTGAGHDAVVDNNAGAGIGFDDALYVKSGARIATTEEA